MKWFIVLLALLCLVASGNAYQLVGDDVFLENQSFSLTVSPATAVSVNGIFKQSFSVCNKGASTETVYAAYVFDEALLGGSVSYWQQPSFGMVEESYVCQYDFNYSLNVNPGANPHQATCYFVDDTNGSDVNVSVFEHAFKSGNLPTGSIVWDEPAIIGGNNWLDVTSSFQTGHTVLDWYGGKHAYPYTPGLSIVAGACEEWKVSYEPSGSSGKWELFAWTGESWSCILDNSCTKLIKLDPWWNSNYLFKRQISFAAQPYEIGTTFQIEWTSSEFDAAQADLDDLRIVDESDLTDLNRSCEGTNLDGNCFFRLQRDILSGESNIFVYYGNGAASAPNFYGLDTNAYGGEVGETVPPGTGTGNTSVFEQRFGLQSYVLDGIQSFAVTGAGLGLRASDLNYSAWMFLSRRSVAGSALTDFILQTGAAETICRIGMRQDGATNTFWWGGGANDTGYMWDLNIWYNVQLSYEDTSTDCNLTIYRLNAGGDLNSEVFVDTFAIAGDTVSRISYQNNKAGSVVFFDNFTVGLPTAISSLGAEEFFADEVDVNHWRVAGFDPHVTEFPIFTASVDGNLTIDFNVFNEDNNRMLVDVNFSTSNNQGTGTVIVEDLNLSDVICGSNVFSTVTSCSWDWNIDAVADGNYFLLFDLNSGGVGGIFNTNFEASVKSLRVAVPHLRIKFRDENTGLPLVGLTVEGGGSTTTTDGSGEVLFSLSSTSPSPFIIRAFDDANYISRYFEFDVNISTRLDVNALMLRDINGIDYNFVWYETDETTVLANERIFVYNASDGNFVSIRTTNADGSTSFFLHPDQNYFFITATQRFDKIFTTFNVPLDEDTLAAVSPYSMSIRKLAGLNFVDVVAPVTTSLFPNTVNTYRFDLNGTAIYFPRTREINFRGNPQTATIQMYLVRITDSVQSVFFTRRAADLAVVPGVTIRVFKTIVGAGFVEVETVVTDDAGTATLAFIIDDEYQLDFYNAAGTFLFSKTLNPNFAQYFVYIDTGGFEWNEPDLEYINIRGLPTVGYVAFTRGIGEDVNVTIDVNNGTILNSWLTITNDDGNVTFDSACGAGCGYTIEDSDMNNTGGVRVTVFVETASGLKLSKTWAFLPYDSSSSNMIATMRSSAFREEWGCSGDPNEPCFFLLMISAFFIIAMIAVAGKTTGADNSALGIIAMVGMAIFTYLTWIPVAYFIISCVAVFGSIIIAKRGF